MIRLSELRNQLKNQNLDTVEPKSFKQVGGSVFPDNKAKLDLDSLRDIITGFQAVHLPSYGHSIAGSSYAKRSDINSATTTKLLEPAINEVYRVDVVSVVSEEAGTSFNFAMMYNSDAGVVSLGLNKGGELTPTNTELPQLAIGQSLIVSYPQILQCTTTSDGTVDVTVMIGYTKLQQ